MVRGRPEDVPDGAPIDPPVDDLETAVAKVLDALEPGDVVTYGEVALEAGYPGRSRAVGRILSTSGGAYPWWRVVNAAGRLVPGHEEEQARRLAGEGVELRNGKVRRARR
jgi:methylated-DNA-protein-cysteine methyltransferase-like protein